MQRPAARLRLASTPNAAALLDARPRAQRSQLLPVPEDAALASHAPPPGAQDDRQQQGGGARFRSLLADLHEAGSELERQLARQQNSASGLRSLVAQLRASTTRLEDKLAEKAASAAAAAEQLAVQLEANGAQLEANEALAAQVSELQALVAQVQGQASGHAAASEALKQDLAIERARSEELQLEVAWLEACWEDETGDLQDMLKGCRQAHAKELKSLASRHRAELGRLQEQLARERAAGADDRRREVGLRARLEVGTAGGLLGGCMVMSGSLAIRRPADAAARCAMPPTQGQVVGTQEELALALERSRQLEQQVSEAQANLDNSISANEALADEQVALQQRLGELQALVAQLQGELERERASGAATQARCAELEVRRDDGKHLMLCA
jgi:hypothetical protein